MEYAVIATGGKQYLVSQGQTLEIETIIGDTGSSVVFDQVLLSVAGDAVVVGSPIVEGLTVQATLVDHHLGDKIRVFKYKPKARYRRTTGHRQHLTLVRIDSIGAAKKNDALPAEKVEATVVSKPRVKKVVPATEVKE